jgi:uncharacterized protein (DUF1800 family)
LHEFPTCGSIPDKKLMQAVVSAALKPWSPSRSAPWDKTRAAHLWNRAGFGGRPDEIDALLKLSPAAAIKQFLNYEQLHETHPDWNTDITPEQFRKFTPEQRKDAAKMQSNNIEDLKCWWLRRMVETKRPLLEKMTLFWHGHFATGAEKVNSPYLMYGQNQTFRAHATGNFRELVLAVCKDPAMNRYLDGNANVKRKPNENFARELMELFTMGVGNYTEDDVKAAARAFTGWGMDGEQFHFHPSHFDDGEKTFLGHTGALDGIDVLDIVVAQPATARFICRKLFEFFSHADPEPEIVDALADVFRESTYEIKPVLAALFASEAFFSARAIRTQIKSPAQLVAGTLRLWQVGAKNDRPYVNAMRQMGQDLFYPPNVKGWPGGEDWINTTTLMERYNFANLVVNNAFVPLPAPPAPAANKAPATPAAGQKDKPEAKVESPKPALTAPALALPLFAGKKETPEQLVDQLAEALLQGPLPDTQRKELIEFAVNNDAAHGGAPMIDPQSPAGLKKLKSLTNLLMSSAAYQLC